VTVWHGSPHESDAFDASKIGTGEGAQAFGHGLYLAENKTVADEYAGNYGILYKVALPESMVARMLDWDKPLSEQNETVKRFFEPYVAETRKALATPGDSAWGDLAAPINFDPTGSELLNILSRHVNPEHGKLTFNTVLTGGTGGAYTSEMLKSAGIPGIRYLDGSSRGAGEGTRNYVMFDDKGIKLLERNGEPIPAVAEFAARREGKPKPYREAMGGQ